MGDLDFFTILLGVGLGFLFSKFIIDQFLGIADKQDGSETSYVVSRSRGCKFHRWVYEVGSKRLVCAVCKQKPSND